MTNKRLYLIVLLIGLLPTIGVFIWGIHLSLQTKAVPFVTPFSEMK